MYGEQPTGHVVAVAQAPQAVAIAEPIAVEPVVAAAVAPSVPSGRDFIPRNQSPPAAGYYLFGEGSQGWGYYAIGSAGCDDLALRLLHERKARSESALRNVRVWSVLFCCLLSQRRAALEEGEGSLRVEVVLRHSSCESRGGESQR